MSERKRTPGAIPPHHRKLAYIVASVFFALLLVTGLALKLLADIPVPWFWIVVTPVFITGLIAGVPVGAAQRLKRPPTMVFSFRAISWA